MHLEYIALTHCVRERCGLHVDHARAQIGDTRIVIPQPELQLAGGDGWDVRRNHDLHVQCDVGRPRAAQQQAKRRDGKTAVHEPQSTISKTLETRASSGKSWCNAVS